MPFWGSPQSNIIIGDWISWGWYRLRDRCSRGYQKLLTLFIACCREVHFRIPIVLILDLLSFSDGWIPANHIHSIVENTPIRISFIFCRKRLWLLRIRLIFLLFFVNIFFLLFLTFTLSYIVVLPISDQGEVPLQSRSPIYLCYCCCITGISLIRSRPFTLLLRF